MELSAVKMIVSATFLLIVVELAIIYLTPQVSLSSMLEVFSIVLVALLYYFIVSTELKTAFRHVTEALVRVEEKFEDVKGRFESVEKKFERVNQSFDEDIEVLRGELSEMRQCVCDFDRINNTTKNSD